MSERLFPIDHAQDIIKLRQQHRRLMGGVVLCGTALLALLLTVF